MSRLLSVSIVLFNNNETQLKKTINCALLSSIVDVLYLIDNSPTRALESIVINERIVYIYNNENLGFGDGHNKVLLFPEKLGKYHLVLNPDIYFNSGVLELLVDYLEINQDVGLIMPKILYPNGQIQYLPKLLPSPWSIIKRKLPIPKSLKNRIVNNYELRFVDENKIIEVPIISGCFSLFRTSVFQKIGIYDSRFFMYFEDFDISRRVCKHFKTIYYPNVFVYHGYERGAQKSWRLLKIFLTSFVKYFNKWGWIADSDRVIVNKITLSNVKNR